MRSRPRIKRNRNEPRRAAPPAPRARSTCISFGATAVLSHRRKNRGASNLWWNSGRVSARTIDAQTAPQLGGRGLSGDSVVRTVLHPAENGQKQKPNEVTESGHPVPRTYGGVNAPALGISGSLARRSLRGSFSISATG